MQNISLACRRAGISRSHFYQIKEAFEKYGAKGLAPLRRFDLAATPLYPYPETIVEIRPCAPGAHPNLMRAPSGADTLVRALC